MGDAREPAGNGSGPDPAVRRTADWYEREAGYDEWLDWWRRKGRDRFVHPDVTVDAVVLTYDPRAAAEESLKVLVVRRSMHPFRRMWALPGTFLHADEPDADAAIARLLATRLGFTPGPDDTSIQQLRTFTGLDRDPRGQVVSIAHLVYVRGGVDSIKGSEDVRWVPLRSARDIDMAFDHNRILDAAIRRMRDQFGWTPLVFNALPAEFTLSDAMRLRSGLFNESYDSIDRKNFRAKYRGFWDVIGPSDPSDPRSPKLYAYATKSTAPLDGRLRRFPSE